MVNNNAQNKRRRVIALLSREEMEFLDKLGLDSLFSTGSKLSRVEIISAFVDAAIALGISAKGIKHKRELADRILKMTHTQPETHTQPGTHTQPDRRKFPRLKKSLIVRFRRIESIEQHSCGTTDNIGMGGFRTDVAFLGKPLAVDQVIEVTISESQDMAKPIKAIGRVAWIKEKKTDHGHEIGVMLTYIKKEDRGRFAKSLSGGIDVRS